MVGVLSECTGHRMVHSAMQDLCGVRMSTGTVNKLRQEASAAVAAPVDEAQEYVQQPVVGRWRPVGRKAMRTKVIH